MVINEHELITNNQETHDNNLISTSSEQTIQEGNIQKNLDNIDNNTTTINSEEIHQTANFSERTKQVVNTTITKQPEQEEVNEQNNENENTKLPEDLSEQKETAETNCLALTVRKNYNVSIIKNSIFTSLRLSFKVAISTLVLNILKLFL